MTFCLIGIIGFTIIIQATTLIINHEKYYKLPKGTKHLIMGHSHTECALNDSFIDNCINVSMSGESLFYTNIKIRKILAHNKGIKRIYLSFSNNNITTEMEEWVFRSQYVNNRFPKYAPIMSLQEKELLLMHNFYSVVKSLFDLFRNNILFIIQKKDNFIVNNEIGGYNQLFDTCSIDNLKKHQDKLQKPYSSFGLMYLDMICTLCEQENVELVLIRTPIHTLSAIKQNELLFNSIYKERYSYLKFLDFSNFELDNYSFRDFEHLNFEGALKFSKYFNKMVLNARENQ